MLYSHDLTCLIHKFDHTNKTEVSQVYSFPNYPQEYDCSFPVLCFPESSLLPQSTRRTQRRTVGDITYQI
jgi:hypothetical protein